MWELGPIQLIVDRIQQAYEIKLHKTVEFKSIYFYLQNHL